MKELAKFTIVAGGVTLSSFCFATNGVQLVGYGAKAAGMGGASVALPQDSLAAANNPAGMAEVGTRVDGDFQILYVETETDFLNDQNTHSGKRYAPIPEFGANYQIDDQLSLGFSTAVSGVLFKYDDSLLPNLDRAKAGFLQAVGLPTLSYKLNDKFSVGLSLALAVQRFEAQGIPLPDGSAGFPSHGAQYAYGAGWRAGALWKPTEWLSVGTMYSAKIKMSEIDGYKDDVLSTVGGSIDVPEQYAVGISVTPTDRLTLAADWLHISWQNVDVYHDLFGWRSQDVFHAGAAYKLTHDWTIRAGVSKTRKQFNSDFATQNALLVGVNPVAATMGFTKDFGSAGELTMGYEHDFTTSADGTGPSQGSKIKTSMGFLTVGYGYKF